MAESKLLTLLKKVVTKLEENTSAETKLAEAVIKGGGTVVSAGEFFEVGAEVFLINEAGEQVPAPVGTHELESGDVLVVEQEGIVASYTAAPELKDEKKEEEMNEYEDEKKKEMALTPEEQTAIVTEVMQILEPRIAALESAILNQDAMTEELEKVVTAMSKNAAKSVKTENAESKKKQISEFQKIRSKYSKI